MRRIPRAAFVVAALALGGACTGPDDPEGLLAPEDVGSVSTTATVDDLPESTGGCEALVDAEEILAVPYRSLNRATVVYTLEDGSVVESGRYRHGRAVAGVLQNLQEAISTCAEENSGGAGVTQLTGLPAGALGYSYLQSGEDGSQSTVTRVWAPVDTFVALVGTQAPVDPAPTDPPPDLASVQDLLPAAIAAVQTLDAPASPQE